LFGFGDMQQAFLQIEGLYVAIVFRVSERLVNVDEADALVGIISLDRFQTGNVSKEGRSG